MSKAVTIKYRGGRQEIKSLKADYCSGVVPTGSSTSYRCFRLNNKDVGRVAEGKCDPEKCVFCKPRKEE
jgi:hypothetical protein